MGEKYQISTLPNRIELNVEATPTKRRSVTPPYADMQMTMHCLALLQNVSLAVVELSIKARVDIDNSMDCRSYINSNLNSLHTQMSPIKSHLRRYLEFLFVYTKMTV